MNRNSVMFWHLLKMCGVLPLHWIVRRLETLASIILFSQFTLSVKEKNLTEKK